MIVVKEDFIQFNSVINDFLTSENDSCFDEIKMCNKYVIHVALDYLFKCQYIINKGNKFDFQFYKFKNFNKPINIFYIFPVELEINETCLEKDDLEIKKLFYEFLNNYKSFILK